MLLLFMIVENKLNKLVSARPTQYTFPCINAVALSSSERMQNKCFFMPRAGVANRRRHLTNEIKHNSCRSKKTTFLVPPGPLGRSPPKCETQCPGQIIPVQNFSQIRSLVSDASKQTHGRTNIHTNKQTSHLIFSH